MRKSNDFCHEFPTAFKIICIKLRDITEVMLTAKVSKHGAGGTGQLAHVGARDSAESTRIPSASSASGALSFFNKWKVFGRELLFLKCYWTSHQNLTEENFPGTADN